VNSLELRRKLEAQEQREVWEREQPEAMADAFERGNRAGFAQGWEAAMQYLAQLCLAGARIHREHPPDLPAEMEQVNV
jgi:flagellar biosynthesis/type III secretory pathway protein FliH